MKTLPSPQKALHMGSMEENVLTGMTPRDFSSLLCILKIFFNEYNSKTNKNDSILPKFWL